MGPYHEKKLKRLIYPTLTFSALTTRLLLPYTSFTVVLMWLKFLGSTSYKSSSMIIYRAYKDQSMLVCYFTLILKMHFYLCFFVSASMFWKHPLLLHTKEPITKPLTSLPSEDLHQRALELFRSCHMFMALAIDSPQIDYHVSLAQNILETCLQYSELQNEIYCQLIKQTSRHPPQHKSGVQVRSQLILPDQTSSRSRRGTLTLWYQGGNAPVFTHRATLI